MRTCERCGREYTADDTSGYASVTYANMEHVGLKEYYLCEDCALKVVEFIEGKCGKHGKSALQGLRETV